MCAVYALSLPPLPGTITSYRPSGPLNAITIREVLNHVIPINMLFFFVSEYTSRTYTVLKSDS